MVLQVTCGRSLTTFGMTASLVTSSEGPSGMTAPQFIKLDAFGVVPDP